MGSGPIRCEVLVSSEFVGIFVGVSDTNNGLAYAPE